MAERMLAKKYLRGLKVLDVPKTEPECVRRLIAEHHRMWTELHGASPVTWFGRMMWKLFGRWL